MLLSQTFFIDPTITYYYYWYMKYILTISFLFISFFVYSQFVLSAKYTLNDTSTFYVDTLVQHYNLDFSEYKFITYSDSIYDVLSFGDYRVTSYHCFKYREDNKVITFTKELFNSNGPISNVGYIFIEDIDYVNTFYGRDRTTIYIFD